ncbi:MAG: GNAT family N-acetyltransferase [Flavobacteriales bacterium]|nr:GNAT family N-acetyltransferase [Flavobacteriales bacterium]
MRIATLAETTIPELVEVFLKAFEGYFVALPKKLAYWEDRFRSAGVDLSRSYGAYDGDQLVAFIIHGIGVVDGEPTAFNTGTGVLPAYRGRRVVDAIYAEALPALRAHGIAQSTLEVITKNIVAIRLYERIGFQTIHLWRSFIGSLTVDAAEDQLHPAEFIGADLGPDTHYSWDYRIGPLLLAPQRWQLFTLNGDLRTGHVLLDPSTGRVGRLGVADEQDAAQWQRLLKALAAVKSDVRVINVHPERTALIESLLARGLANIVDQYEMRLRL